MDKVRRAMRIVTIALPPSVSASASVSGYISGFGFGYGYVSLSVLGLVSVSGGVSGFVSGIGAGAGSGSGSLISQSPVPSLPAPQNRSVRSYSWPKVSAPSLIHSPAR